MRCPHLEDPGAGLRAVLLEAGALLAGHGLQPALVVHLRQALGALDQAARGFVRGPHPVQGDLSSPARAGNRLRQGAEAGMGNLGRAAEPSPGQGNSYQLLNPICGSEICK